MNLRMFRPTSWIVVLLSWLTAFLCPDRLIAQSVTLKAVADTSLYEPSPNNNMGREPTMISGQRSKGGRTRGLVRFDLSSIPPNAIITSAALTLAVVKTPSAGVTSTFDLRRVLVVWAEGTKTTQSGGSAATAGEATWNNRLHPATAWAAPGGKIGSDFASTISASKSVSGNGNYMFMNLASDVQSWLSDPASNNGWVFLSESETTPSTIRRFAAREAPSSGPSLRIDYVIPPRISAVERNGDIFSLRFEAEANETYEVQFREAVSKGSWMTLTNLGPNAVKGEVVAKDLLSASPQRFYRVRKP